VISVGCKETIHTRSSEHSANEVLGALLDAGVDANKVQVDEKTFDVEVAASDVPRALAVLRVHGLPRVPSETLGQLFKKDGLVSTPAEERIRYIYGVSQELERTLQHIDGVVQGRVHIVIPANDPLSETKKTSSASVFVKYRPPADPSILGPLVRSLVMRGVEGLDAEHVSVAFVAGNLEANAQPVKLVHWMGLKVSSDSVPWLWSLLVLPGLAACAYLGVRRWGSISRAVREASDSPRSTGRKRPIEREAPRGSERMRPVRSGHATGPGDELPDRAS
jgi:type III secretion protein J